MLALAAELDAAVAAADWDRLELAANAMPARLERLAARGALAPAEQAALAHLRAAWDKASAACGRAARALGARLDDMHMNKEGRMAYALAGDPDPADSGR